jgi:hypothetical protein
MEKSSMSIPKKVKMLRCVSVVLERALVCSDLQGKEDESFIGSLSGAAHERRRPEEAVVLVVILGGEDEGCEPAGLCVRCVCINGEGYVQI